MNCPVQDHETREILLDFCAGKLPVAAAAELQRHMAACPACRAFAASLSRMWTKLDAWKAESVSPGFDQKLYARIAESEQRPSWTRKWTRWLAGHLSWRPALSAAAAGAMALALLVNAPTTTEPAAPPPAHVENTKIDPIEPEQVERTLEDLDMLNQLSASGNQDL